MPLPPAAYLDASAPRAVPTLSAWDDDDSWEAAYERPNRPGSEQERNVRLWQDANTLQPTYSILASSSATRAVPPPAALDPRTTNGPPKLTILKRPSPAASPTNAPPRAGSADARAREKSLKEREREYAEARRRIYGDEASASAPAALARSVEKLALSGGGGVSRRARPASGRASPSPRASPASGSRAASPPGSSASRERAGTAPAHCVREPAAPAAAAGAPRIVRVPKGPNADSGFGFVGAKAAPEAKKSGRRAGTGHEVGRRAGAME
ncbi:hypothetical protein JCM3770_002940 [Rhodotorula araucariae]